MDGNGDLRSFPYGMDVSLNGGTPISHPKMIIFKENPMVVGYHHLKETPVLRRDGKINPHFLGLQKKNIRIPVTKGGMSLSIKS